MRSETCRANISAESTHSLKHFVYLVGLHIYHKMIHGPYNIKLSKISSEILISNSGYLSSWHSVFTWARMWRSEVIFWSKKESASKNVWETLSQSIPFTSSIKHIHTVWWRSNRKDHRIPSVKCDLNVSLEIVIFSSFIEILCIGSVHKREKFLFCTLYY